MKKNIFIVLHTVCFVLQFNSLHAQNITTVAGTGVAGYNGDGIPATSAKLNNAPRIAVDDCGNIYIGDAVNQRVRKIDVMTGIITTVAGTGVAGYNGDGIPATSAQLNLPIGLAFDNLDNLYIAEGNDSRVRKVDMVTGIISTYVGTGTTGFSGDSGPATAAMINTGDIAFDPFGNLYMSDLFRIRKIDPSGIITTIAGTGLRGTTVLGVPATSTIVHPWPAIATDLSGNLYTVDSSGVILKITASTGILSKVAGSGINTTPYTGDGIPATTCNMNPAGLYVDDTGSIFAACYINNICIKIDTFGFTHTVAGTGVSGSTGDGAAATAAKLWWPKDIEFDHFGHMYIADWENNRIRKVTYPYTLTSPTILLSGIVSAPTGSSVTITATVSGAGSTYIIHWLNHGVEFATTTIPSVTYAKPPGIDTITARVVSTCGFYDSTTSAGHEVVAVATGNVQTWKYANVQIYPNPAQNMLIVEGSEPISSITFSNVMRQVVLNKECNTERVEVVVRGLPAGVYLVEVISSNGERITKKLIKQ